MEAPGGQGTGTQPPQSELRLEIWGRAARKKQTTARNSELQLEIGARTGSGSARKERLGTPPPLKLIAKAISDNNNELISELVY